VTTYKFFGRRPKNLDASGPAIKTNCHFAGFNDHRDFARALGMFQHLFKLAGIGYNVEIFNIVILFGICFTSCPCVWSGIFAENQYFFRHG
jgi:hypothetical protein